MSANRITEHFGRKSNPARVPEPPAGFAAVPMHPLKEGGANCQSARSIYEMAYLFARMGYVVGK